MNVLVFLVRRVVSVCNYLLENLDNWVDSKQYIVLIDGIFQLTYTNWPNLSLYFVTIFQHLVMAEIHFHCIAWPLELVYVILLQMIWLTRINWHCATRFCMFLMKDSHFMHRYLLVLFINVVW